MSPRILIFSSSRAGDGQYLEMPAPHMGSFLGNAVQRIAFIPFASVGDYSKYLEMVQAGLQQLPCHVDLVMPETAREQLEQAEAIMVGGGNSFKLLHDLYAADVLNLIREKVQKGTPYIGWSAGANVAGPGIGTTNDMPIIQPHSFKSFAFLPFQINPHYVNIKLPGHNGESRDQRLEEFIRMNPTLNILAIPEGTGVKREGDSLEYIGTDPAYLFQLEGNEVIRKEITSATNLHYLLGS